MSFSFEDFVQGVIEKVVIILLWQGIRRLFRFWGRWIDWTSPAGILLIVWKISYLALWYFGWIRFMDFRTGAVVAASIIVMMLMLVHLNIMARVELSKST